MEYNQELFKIEGTTLISYMGNEGNIVIPEGVTKVEELISRYSDGDENIKSIYIPSTVREILINFGKLKELERIDVSEENIYFSSVEGVLFSKDKSTLIRYPAARKASRYIITSNVMRIEEYAFENIKFPISIAIENGITQIDESAFCMCKGLHSISIPNSVMSIGDGAFAHCENLLNISIPNSVISIGDKCFWGCKSILNIVIPESVVTVAPKSFVEIENYEEHLRSSINHGLFNYCENLTSVIILAKITYIPSSAFKGCKNLRTVVLPNTIKSICDFAFEECDLLESINIPDKIDIISRCAFGYEPKCPAIKGKKVHTSYGFEYTLDEMDIYKTTLNKVRGNYSSTQKIPDGITIVAYNAFGKNDIVEKIVIPSSVKKVESMAFSGCEKLKQIIVNNVDNVEIAGDCAMGAKQFEHVYADKPALIDFYEVEHYFGEYYDDDVRGGYTESDFGCREEYLEWLEDH